MKNTKKLIITLVCAFVLLLSACGKSSSTARSDSPLSSTTEQSEAANNIQQGLNQLLDAANSITELTSNITGSLTGTVESVQNILPSSGSYEEIYESYSQKIRAATPGLIQEFLNEAPNNNTGLEGLATLSNSKVEKLALISNEGVEKMAQYMMTAGSGKYDEYQEWSGKLYDVYMEETEKIMDTYLNYVAG